MLFLAKNRQLGKLQHIGPETDDSHEHVALNAGGYLRLSYVT